MASYLTVGRVTIIIVIIIIIIWIFSVA